MKAIIVALSLICAMTVANAQLLTAAAIIIGAKILIGKGFIVGAAGGYLARNHAENRGLGRFGRAAGDFNEALLEQNQKDVNECFKLLVCHLNSKPINKLDADEFAIATTFGQTDVLDVTEPTILYDVAAHIGRKAGDKQCRAVYPRCASEVENIMKEIKKAVYGN